MDTSPKVRKRISRYAPQRRQEAMISRTTDSRKDLAEYLNQRGVPLLRVEPCRLCRDELGDQLDDFPATAPGDRPPCDDPACNDGWVVLEKCDGCGEYVREVTKHGEEYLCWECLDERRDLEAMEPIRQEETINLVDYAARICGMKS